MRSNSILLISFIIFGVLFSSCSVSPEPENIHASQGNSTGPLVTLTDKEATSTHPSPTVTSTPRPSSTATLRATPIRATPTPMQPRGYSDLPDGEYILYFKVGVSALGTLGIISLDKEVHQTFIQAVDVYLSPNHKHVVIIPEENGIPLLIDLETMGQEELGFLKGCFDVHLSPDERYFIVSCISEEQSWEMYFFSRDGKRKIQLTNCSVDNGNCSGTQFSPDGEWISYYWSVSGAIISSKPGLYLLNRECIQQNEVCRETASGPFKVTADYAWAKDSKHLASSWDQGIAIFELQGNNTVRKIREIKPPSGYYYDDVIWSTDSTMLAYTKGNRIGLINVESEESIEIGTFNEGIFLRGWVNLKNGKVTAPRPLPCTSGRKARPNLPALR